MRNVFGTARATRSLAAAALIASVGCSAGASRTSSADGAQAPITPPPTSATASPRSDRALPAVPSEVARTPLGDLLVLRGPSGATVVDSATGSARTTVAGALPAPDGATLIQSAAGRVSAVDSRDGSTRDLGTATPTLVPVVTTSDGRRVALAEPAAAPAADGYIAAGRSTSRIAVTAPSGPPAVYELAGNYQPEAFSTDGGLLFLIEYLPPAAPDRYRVRQLDLATGIVNGVLGPQKQILEEEMRGIGRMQLLDERRSVLYTLYRTIGSDRAFVHTLHLDGLWAHCIVLPPEFGQGGADTAMTLDPGTGTLYAWDGANVSVIDGEQMQVRRTVLVRTTPSSGGKVAVTITPDGTLVTVADGTIAELDAATLVEKAAWPIPFSADGIAASGDSSQLFVTDGAHVNVVDRVAHGAVAQFPVTAGDRITAVLSAHG